MRLHYQPAVAPAHARRRQQRLVALQREVQARGLRTRLTRPHDRPWELLVWRGMLPLPRQKLVCAGADDVFFIIATAGKTAGRILGSAAPSNLPVLADALIEWFSARPAWDRALRLRLRHPLR